MDFLHRAEFSKRIRRVNAQLTKSSLDALMITSDENVRYFSHARPFVPWASFTRPIVILIPKNSEPILIINESFVDLTRKISPVRRIITYGKPTSLVKVVSDSIQRFVRRKARVGCEFGYEQRLGISYLDFTRIA